MFVNTKEVSYGLLPFFLAKVVLQPASAMEFKSWLCSLKLYTMFMFSLEERHHTEESLLFSAVNSYLHTLCGILPEETFFLVEFQNFHLK